MKRVIYTLIFICLTSSFALAGQTAAPCVFFTYTPSDIPFAYDPNLCERQIIGWFDMYAGQRARCTINICAPDDYPVDITILDAKPNMSISGYTLEWNTEPNDTGLHYVSLAGTATSASGATILFNLRPDYRPVFDIIEDRKVTGKKIKYYKELADAWLN